MSTKVDKKMIFLGFMKFVFCKKRLFAFISVFSSPLGRSGGANRARKQKTFVFQKKMYLCNEL